MLRLPMWLRGRAGALQQAAAARLEGGAEAARKEEAECRMPLNKTRMHARLSCLLPGANPIRQPHHLSTDSEMCSSASTSLACCKVSKLRGRARHC